MRLQRNQHAIAKNVRELLDTAFASRYHDLAKTLKLSSAAVALVEENRQELPPDLVVAAWTQYGNALRIAGRYADSERALERASTLPVSDSSTKANLLEVKASLHRNTGRFDSAARLLSAAREVHKSTGDSLGEARTLNLLGIVYAEVDDRPRALRAFQTSLDLLGPDTPIDTVVITGHNLLEALIQDGRLAAATSAFALLEPFYRGSSSRRLSAKAEWINARLCRELHQFHAAQLAYERAYALLIDEPRSPELPALLKEMADLKAAMSSSPDEPEMEMGQK